MEILSKLTERCHKGPSVVLTGETTLQETRGAVGGRFMAVVSLSFLTGPPERPI